MKKGLLLSIILIMCFTLTSCLSFFFPSENTTIEAAEHISRIAKLNEDETKIFTDKLVSYVGDYSVYFEFDELEQHYTFISQGSNTSLKAHADIQLRLSITPDYIIPYVCIYYSGDDWIFMESGKVYTDENEYTFKIDDVNRQIFSPRVMESANIFLLDESLDIFEEFINSKQRQAIRIYGDHSYVDSDIDENGSESIMRILELYHLLKK